MNRDAGKANGAAEQTAAPSRPIRRTFVPEDAGGQVRSDYAYLFFLANVIVLSSFLPFFSSLPDFLAMRFSFMQLPYAGNWISVLQSCGQI